MTTTTWSTTAQVSSDATFRTAGLEINAALAALGCIQTADTGQINWTTVTWPAVNVDAGYEIWRFNDALQGTAPVFFKIMYGRPNNGSSPVYIRMVVTVGSGSNGSGTITGTTNNPSAIGKIAVANAGNWPSYGCMVNGNLNLSLKVGSAAEAWLSICRTQDATGADTGAGVMMMQRSTSDNVGTHISTINFGTSTRVQDNVQNYNCMRIGNVSSSVTGGNNQAYLLWGAYPHPLAHIGVCGVIEGEIAHGATFTAALVGGTSRTYLCMTNNLVYIGTGLRACMLYE